MYAYIRAACKRYIKHISYIDKIHEYICICLCVRACIVFEFAVPISSIENDNLVSIVVISVLAVIGTLLPIIIILETMILLLHKRRRMSKIITSLNNITPQVNHNMTTVTKTYYQMEPKSIQQLDWTLLMNCTYQVKQITVHQYPV